MEVKKVDKILDMCLRLVLFGYSATLLGITLFQIERDKQFLILIGLFAIICTGIYLFEGIYVYATGKKLVKLRKFLYGEEGEEEEQPAMRKVVVILLLFAVIVISAYLFGVFITVFVAMTLFPVLYDKRKLWVSVLVAAVTCGLFYYVFVYMMGVRLIPGLIVGF